MCVRVSWCKLVNAATLAVFSAGTRVPHKGRVPKLFSGQVKTRH